MSAPMIPMDWTRDPGCGGLLTASRRSVKLIFHQCQIKTARDEPAYSLVCTVEGNRSQNETDPPTVGRGNADPLSKI